MTPEEAKIIHKCMHDMNNALVSITGFAEMVNDGDSPERDREFSQHILDAAIQMENKLGEIKSKLFKEKG